MRRRDVLAGLPWVALASPAAAATPPKKLIVVIANGGWDPTMALDPKIGVDGIAGGLPDEDLGDPLDRETTAVIGAIDIAHNPVKRPAVAQFFENWGAYATVVRGLYTSSLSHVPCMDRTLMGRGMADLATTFGAMGAWTPFGAVDLSAMARPGPWPDRVSRLGTQGQISWLVDPATEPAATGATVSTRSAGPLTQAALDAATTARLARLDAAWGGWGVTQRNQLADAQRQAAALREAAPDTSRNTTLQLDLMTTVELMSSGLATAALVDSRATWDTHAEAGKMHGSYNRLFIALGTLMNELTLRGLRDDTLVCVLSELGRTPWRNDELGTDHWPWTAALLMGGGLPGDRVIGATDDGLTGLPVDLSTGDVTDAGETLQLEALTGGILQALGIGDDGPNLQLT